MAQDDFPPFRIPALGRWIARAFVTLGAGAKALRPRGLGRVYSRGVEIAQRHYLVPVYLLAFILSPFWALLVFEVIVNLLDQLSLTAPSEPDARRAHFYAIGLTITGLGALLAAPFILIKAWVNERTARTAEQGHITDRITKAVEQLGAEKTVKVLEDGKTVERTEPNLEVRLGAIYALERIAQDSERDHIPIMETLCAYVRENSNARKAQEPLNVTKEEKQRERSAVTIDQAYTIKLFQWARSLPFPRTDVQAALTVIGRRSALRRAHETARGYRLDLTHANLQGADLSALALERTLLTGARMEGAQLREVWMEASDLTGARLEGTDLSGARMQGVRLNVARIQGADASEAQMKGADLSGAEMQGAYLSKAQMEGANLRGARMEWTNLSEARMEGANFVGARMEGADLIRTSMEGADLRQAKLNSADLAFWNNARANARSADFTGAKAMTQDQVNAMFGDSKTILPEGLRRTDLMDREPLENWWDDDRDYKAWLAAGAPPGKPLP